MLTQKMLRMWEGKGEFSEINVKIATAFFEEKNKKTKKKDKITDFTLH